MQLKSIFEKYTIDVITLVYQFSEQTLMQNSLKTVDKMVTE